MTSAIRYARAHTRMRALKSRLWTAADRPLLLEAWTDPDGRPVSGDPGHVYPPLVRWYETLMGAAPDGRRALAALLRLHEAENLKLLWRAAFHRSDLVAGSWRPLEPLATISPADRAASVEELAERLASTPYGALARTLLRSHPHDLLAVEIGIDRWASAGLGDAARALPRGEAAAACLLLAVCRERDVTLLRRGARSFGLAPDLVAKSTIVLSTECRIEALVRMAMWTPAAGPLAAVLPPPLLRMGGDVPDWPALEIALREHRRRACRRAFVQWPFQLAPLIAAVLLREGQGRLAIGLAAARRARAAARPALRPALAASAVEG